MDAIAHAFSRIQSSGNRLTEARKAIVVTLADAKAPLSIKEIANSVAADEASVYRSIALFRKIGIVEEIVLPDGMHRFSLAHGHHHHIACTVCGTVVHVPCASADAVASPEHPAFARVDAHDLMFYGVCVSCARGTV